MQLPEVEFEQERIGIQFLPFNGFWAKVEVHHFQHVLYQLLVLQVPNRLDQGFTIFDIRGSY